MAARMSWRIGAATDRTTTLRPACLYAQMTKEFTRA